MTISNFGSEGIAAKIAGLLALAEDAAKQNNDQLRDTYLDKATALQLKYVIDEAMIAKNTGTKSAEAIITEDFCKESNTTLIKAKRMLINVIAMHLRGKAVIMPEWKVNDKGVRKIDRRAFVRVWAHESDMAIIRMMYTSLLLQMNSMMAHDERRAEWDHGRGKVPAAWRVSYGHAWVNTIHQRLHEIRARQEAASQSREPGTALVLRDKSVAVNGAMTEAIGRIKTTRHPVSDTNASGRAAGRTAAERADLGQSRVNAAGARQIGQ